MSNYAKQPVKICCINTITNFKELIFDPFAVPFMQENPNVQIFNITDDTLLSETMEAGSVTPSINRRILSYILAAKERGAQCVMCTCTSVSAASRQLEKISPLPVFNIADPVARQAVEIGKKIGVLATLPTSPKAIISSIRLEAEQQKKEIEIVTRVAQGAFDVLCSGDRNKHDEMVLNELKNLAKEVDLIVFAQISMSLLPEIDCGVPILKIGKSGYQEAVRLALENGGKE